MKRLPYKKRSFKLPPWLVPETTKSQAAIIFEGDDPWRRFADGCLGNVWFRKKILEGRPKCKACNRNFNGDGSSKIDRHHVTYLHRCKYEKTLPPGHEDIYEFPGEHVDVTKIPDCRSCPFSRECLAKVMPLHRSCHTATHQLEIFFRDKRSAEFQKSFHSAA